MSSKQNDLTIEQIEERLYLFYVSKGDELELSKKKNWFELKINSMHKDKSIEICNLVPSMEVFFNIRGNENKLYFYGATWLCVFEEIWNFTILKEN